MLLKINLFLGALALIGASGIMASDCGSDATKTIVGQSSYGSTYRSSTSHIPYSRDGGWGENYKSRGTARATAEDRSYPRRSVQSSSGSYDSPSSGRVGRKENL